jgi:hypothetical protein
LLTFRIPKPSGAVTLGDVTNAPPWLKNQGSLYLLSILNWASLPDELFEKSGDLMACSPGAMGSNLVSDPKRLEVILQSEDGRMLRSWCNPPQPQILSNLRFTLQSQAKPEKVYVTLKDRLTGNTVRSDPVPLP